MSKELDTNTSKQSTDKKTNRFFGKFKSSGKEEEILKPSIDNDVLKPLTVDPSKIKPVKSIETNLSLNVKVYNYYIDYLPSDFTIGLIKNLFIVKKKCNLPPKTKIAIELFPNDAEKNLKVLVKTDRYYKNGIIVNKQKMFKPFWIIGFQTYTFMVLDDKPKEALYRVNDVHNFAYREASKIRGKKLSSVKLDPKKSNYQVEEDFVRARESKNWFIQQYVDQLNKLSNVEWECIPQCVLSWSKKELYIKLFIKVEKTIRELKTSKMIYADKFVVKLNNVLDFSKTEDKLIDIDTIMYLVSLNAMYKSIKIFSYSTLYEVYKILCASLLTKGYMLKDISATNLSSLKIVDFSKHFICPRTMFNDSLLHIMNLMSSHEEYYRMKYIYTTQKNPTLLYNDFIVREFKDATVNELSTIIKNQSNDSWNKRLLELDESNMGSANKNKNFYINNYNVLDVTNNKYKSVEEFLMGLIKEDKDEISRISKIGEELLRIEENPRFNAHEMSEIKKAAKKLNDDYKVVFFKKKNKDKKPKLYL